MHHGRVSRPIARRRSSTMDEDDAIRSDHAILWRYLDLPKLVSLLSTRALFFASGKHLGDDYEGSIPKEMADDYLIRFTAWARMTHAERREKKVRAFDGTIPSRENAAEALRARDYHYVSCWHMNRGESSAMWSLYGLEAGAVALRSTVGRLRSVLPSGSYVGAVRYLDFDGVYPELRRRLVFDPSERFFFKRRSFAHEREYRAVLLDERYRPRRPCPPPWPGKSVPVDLDRLVSRVYVAPKAPAFVEQGVRSLCATYGLKASVQRSDLDRDPVF